MKSMRPLGALIFVMAGVASACAATPESSSPQDSALTAFPERPTSELDVVATIDLGPGGAPGYADWMGIGFGSLWAPVHEGGGASLLRIDPVTHAVAARIAIEGNGA